MALGAHRALEAMGLESISIVGVDGFSGENGGIELVRSGVIDQTITCPAGGWEAVQFSLDILGEVSGVPKQVILRSHSITRDNVDAFERGLTKIPKPSEEIVDVGYAQVGTESQWRIANNESIRMAERDFGIALTCVDANQSQARQMAAVREFIRRKVDVISNYLAENSGTRIDVVFAHNDDMAIGAIDALRENGCDPGGDIKIVSVDGTKSAFKAMISGELNCTVECSPLLGPQLMKAVTDLMSGKELPLRIITDEKVYTQETAVQEIKQRKY